MSTSCSRWVMTAIGEPLVYETFTPALPQTGEVTVEIAGCGVCHTDLGFLYDGVRTNHPLPLTLGHEISGRVCKTGDGAENWLGKAVVISAVIPCGECDLCRRGKGTICRNQKMPGNDIDGGFATHITVPANGLTAVDEEKLKKTGLELADLSVVADALTTPYQAAMQAGVASGQLVIVIGVGGVGGYAAQVAYALGATVIACDRDQAKLDAIAEAGVFKTINTTDLSGRDVKKQIIALAKDNELPMTEWQIMECSGAPGGQQTAFDLLVHGATLSVVGFTMDKINIRLSNLMAFHARALGNWGCVPEYYAGAIDLVLDGKIKLLPFIERHPLSEINQVFEAAHSHRLTKRAIMVP